LPSKGKELGVACSQRVCVGLALLLVSLAAHVVSANAAIYWADRYKLGVANLDGSYPTYFWSGLPPYRAGMGCGVAVDAQHIYWADRSGAIGRARLDATAPEPAFIENVDNPCGVAVNGQHIYWGSGGGHSIGRADIDGSNPERNFITGLDEPCGVAVDESHVYWADLDDESIGRADLDGGKSEQLFIEGADGACGVAVDNAHIFWGTYGHSIGRANLDGSMPNTEFITGLERPCGVATNGSRVFWSEEPGVFSGSLGTASVDGSAINRGLVTGLASPCGVAVDSWVLNPGPPPTGPHFEFGKIHHVHGKGIAFVPVAFPAGGTAKLSRDGGVSARFLPERTESVALAAAGVKWIKLSVDRRTVPGRRLLHRLKRSGRQRVSFGLEYMEESGKGTWRKKELNLLMRRAHR
jgi:hypothetical protein